MRSPARAGKRSDKPGRGSDVHDVVLAILPLVIARESLHRTAVKAGGYGTVFEIADELTLILECDESPCIEARAAAQAQPHALVLIGRVQRRRIDHRGR